MTSYREAALLVTTYCNRQCAECCYRIPTHETLPPQHYDWTYFETAAKYLSGLDTLYVSGGEPTLHPEFPRIATEFRALFTPKRMVLATNGLWVAAYAEYMIHFDTVRVTDFGGALTADEIAKVENCAPGRLWVRPALHVPFVPAGRGYPCVRRNVPAYANGQLYPCCVAPGLASSASIEPSSDWRERLAALPLPCASCAFSESLR
jgi:hypothetical protein